MIRTDLFWGGALAIVVLFAYGLIPTPTVHTPFDSFSEAGPGKKAFFLIADELLDDVDRSSTSLVPEDPDADTLVLLGPARYPERAQWQTLHDWVAEGRALVFAARRSDPAVALEPFGLEVVPLNEDDSSGDTEETRETSIETELVDVESSPFEWTSEAEVRVTDGAEVSVALSVDGAAQVVGRAVGDGAIVVVASDHIFTNRALTEDHHGLLAFRILESAGPVGPVYFDESMNAAGSPRVVGILLEEPFRSMTFQLILVAVLFGWMAGRRFGPVVTDETVERRSLVEHAEALGNLHFEVGTGGRLLTTYLEYFRRELGLRHASGDGALELDPSTPLSKDNTLVDAVHTAATPDLSREQLAETIARVARLRTRYEHSGRSE